MSNNPQSVTNMLLAVVIVLLLVSIVIQLSVKSDDNLTAWATIKSRELHTFLQGCRSDGGTLDVRPYEAPSVVFVCLFSDRSIEYTLAPGK